MHIKFLCSSLSKTYYMIKVMKHTVSNYVLWNIYFAHFQSKMRYGIEVWGGSKESIKILRIKKKGDKNDDGLEKV